MYNKDIPIQKPRKRQLDALYHYDKEEDAFKWGECLGIIIGGLVFAVAFMIFSVM